MEKALLKCNSEGTSSVAANYHAYKVVDGFVFIDVRPFLRAPKFIQNPDPYGEQKAVPNPLFDQTADAEADATEICRIVSYEEQFGVMRKYRMFEPPSKKERDEWLSDPENLALWEGITVEEASDLLSEPQEEPEAATAATRGSKKG